jgi:hypothetical protein
MGSYLMLPEPPFPSRPGRGRLREMRYPLCITVASTSPEIDRQIDANGYALAESRGAQLPIVESKAVTGQKPPPPQAPMPKIGSLWFDPRSDPIRIFRVKSYGFGNYISVEPLNREPRQRAGITSASSHSAEK